MIKATKSVAFHSVDGVAYRLGVSTAWLRSEAEAGRVPVIRAGKRILMDLDAVRGALVRRSVESCAPSGEAAAC